MRITEVHTHPMSVKVPSDWTSHESIPNSQLILVEVQSDDGLVSFGEIAGGPQKYPYYSGMFAGSQWWTKSPSVISPLWRG